MTTMGEPSKSRPSSVFVEHHHLELRLRAVHAADNSLDGGRPPQTQCVWPRSPPCRFRSGPHVEGLGKGASSPAAPESRARKTRKPPETAPGVDISGHVA